MKNIGIFALLATALVCSCTKEQPQQPATDGGQELVFAANLGETRAAQNYPLNDYFGLGADYRKVTVLYGGFPRTYLYNIEEGVLSAATPTDVLRFSPDGSPMSLVVMQWPETSVAGDAKVVKDQSTYADFLRMDRLEGEVQNVVPTSIIPITLTHARLKITFTLGGAQAGKRITSLTAGEYKAYCDTAVKDAQLMYDLEADAGSLPEGAFIRLKIEGDTEEYVFALKDSPDTLSEGTTGNYTVTLSFNE